MPLATELTRALSTSFQASSESRQLAKVLLAQPFANMAVLSIGNDGNFERFLTSSTSQTT